jgi:O-antigen/teichoic acid export membrane protein
LVPLWVAVTAFPNLLAEIFRGFHDIRLATLFGGVVTTVLNASLFAGLWLLQGHSSLEDVLILAIAAGTTNTLMAAIFLWRKIRPMEGNGQIATREVLTISWPLWLSNMTLFILTQADLWILGIYRAPDEVAVYGAAARLVMAVATPLIVANAVLPPIVAEMYTQDRKQELQRALRATATIAGIPTIAVLIVFLVFGAPIMGMVYGDFYRTGATVLVLLSLGHLVNAAAGSCGLVLMLTGHQMAMLRISLFSGVLAVLAMLWAAPRYGPVGIAAVAATGMTLQNLLMLVTAHRRTQIWTHVDLRHLLAIPVVFRALRPSK